MKTYEHGQWLLMIEATRNGLIIGTAIPDSGDTIRRTFCDYSPAEVRRALIAAIKGL